MNQQRLRDVAIKYIMKKAMGWGGGRECGIYKMYCFDVAEKSAFLVRRKFS